MVDTRSYEGCKEKLDAQTIRRLTFAGISALTFPVIFVGDANDAFDPAFAIYLCTASMSCICLIIYAWWWHSKGRASTMYSCITLLFLAITLQSVVNGLARSMYLAGSLVELQDLYASNLWQYRNLPEMVVLVYLLSFAITRMLFGKDREK